MNDSQWVEEVGRLAEKYLSSAEEAAVKSLLKAYVMDPSEDLKQAIQELISKARVKALEKDFKYPASLVEDGDYFTGYVEDGAIRKMFFLKREELLKHCLIAGVTGSGKTNFSILLASELVQKGMKFWVLDWKKSWRYIFQLKDSDKQDILVFTVGAKEFPFYFNPLIPPLGTDPEEWLKKITDHISDTYYLGEGVKHLLHVAMDKCYREFGVYDGRQVYPTFRNVLKYLHEYKPIERERGWLISALRAVEELCFGHIGKVLNQGNYPLDRLLERNVIFELDSLDNNDKTFFMGILLLWVYFYRINQKSRENLEHVIFLEEAHNLIKRQSMFTQKDSIMDLIVKQIRELGVGVVIIEQDPYLLSIPVLNNTYATVCFNLKERNNIATMSSMLLLEDQSILSKLPVGKAIVRLQDGRHGKHHEPFMIAVPRLKIDKQKPVPLEAVKTRMEEFYGQLDANKQNSELLGESLGFSNPTKMSKIKEESKIEKKETKLEKQESKIEKQTSKVEKLDVKLSAEESRILADILESPTSRIVERYKRIGINSYRGDKTFALLKEKGLIETENITIAGKYWGKASELTESGKACLKKLGYDVSSLDTKRHGGLKHQICIKEIANKYRENGHQAEIEKRLGNGKETDLVVDNKLAIEVEIEGKNVVENVEKNLAVGYTVLLCCDTEADKTRIEKKLAEKGLLEKVKIELLDEVLNNSDDSIIGGEHG